MTVPGPSRVLLMDGWNVLAFYRKSIFWKVAVFYREPLKVSTEGQIGKLFSVKCIYTALWLRNLSSQSRTFPPQTFFSLSSNLRVSSNMTGHTSYTRYTWLSENKTTLSMMGDLNLVFNDFVFIKVTFIKIQWNNFQFIKKEITCSAASCH